jgi:hypothetical protein
LGTLVGCGQSASTTTVADAKASDCGTGPVSSRLVRTAGYELVAAAGPLEATYSRAQVDSQHPSSGEMMVSGHMVGESDMPMSGDSGSGMDGSGTTGTGMGTPGSAVSSGAYRHIEVHICSRTSGHVVQHASPMMVLRDRSAHEMTQQLPIAVMQGVHSGTRDMHYGNNARMIPGHRYSLDVTMEGEHATFDFGAAP